MHNDDYTFDGCGAYGTAETLDARLAGVHAPRLGKAHEVLKQYPDLRKLSQALVERFGNTAGLAECDGSSLPTTLAGPARGFPVWYVRLPAVWRHSMDSLLANTKFNVYLDRDPGDPWHIAQWLPLTARETADGTVVAELRVDEDSVSRSVYAAAESQAVLVFIECDDLLGWTAVAADDDLYDLLQAGHRASSSRALFDCTKACVQSMVRDLQEGRGPKQNPSVLTLPVLDCWEDGPAPDASFNSALKGVAKRPFRTRLTSPGAVGRLPTVVNYIPPGLDDAGKAWLKLEVPAEMWTGLQGASPNVSVAPLPREGASERFIGITVAEGPHLLVAYIDASDVRVSTELSEFVQAGQCSVSLEDQASGHILTVKARWPVECGPVRSQVGALASADGLPRSEREEFERRAAQVSKEEGAQVALYVCEVFDARRWQQHDCDVSSHAVGARGGLVSVDAMERGASLH